MREAVWGGSKGEEEEEGTEGEGKEVGRVEGSGMEEGSEEQGWVEEGRCDRWPLLSLSTNEDAAVRVRQRRYTNVGAEEMHRHRVCVRVFHLYKEKGKGGNGR